MKKIIAAIFLISAFPVFSALKIPTDFAKTEAVRCSTEDENLNINVYARTFSQGDCAYVEIFSRKDLPDLLVTFGSYRIRLEKQKWGWRGYFPISPEHKPGEEMFDVSYSDAGKFSILHMKIEVKKREFEIFESALDIGAYSDVDYEKDPENVKIIKEAKRRKEAAFASNMPLLASTDYSHPRDMHYITSSFWSTRKYKQFKYKGNGKKKRKVFLKESKRIHRGIDFRGKTGTPVYAIAKGKVVLSFKCFYEGNMIVIDHGNRFFTYYMHMEKLIAKEGDVVAAGEQIGEVGSTGISTGSHLHVSAMIDSIQMDALSILALPSGR